MGPSDGDGRENITHHFKKKVVSAFASSALYLMARSYHPFSFHFIDLFSFIYLFQKNIYNREKTKKKERTRSYKIGMPTSSLN